MGRRLSVPKRAPRRPRFYGFDVETYGQKNHFYMVTIYGDGYQKVFYDQEPAIREMQRIVRDDKKAVFVATNLQFDMQALFCGTKYVKMLIPLIRGGDWIGGELTHLKSQKRKSGKIVSRRIVTARFVDTMRYFPVGVKTLGEKVVGVPKLESPTWLGKRCPNTDEERIYFEEYCMRDSEISYKTMVFVNKMAEEMNFSVNMTAPSATLDLWCRNHLDRDIYQMDAKILEKHYGAYYGGRTEVFRRGKPDDDYNYYDFNSLYPSVMREEYSDPNSWKHTMNGSMALVMKYGGISHVKVTSPEYMHKPFLPFRHKSGKLLFPTGTWDAWYSHIEIREAVKLGYTFERIYETVYYTKTWFPFKKFVEEMYARRLRFKKEGNGPKERMCKLFMNSLYGKFAQKMIGQRKIFHIDNIDEEQMANMRERGYSEQLVGAKKDWVYYDAKESLRYPNFVIPILALETTAKARIKLYDAIKDDMTVLYVDTDSLVTKAVLPTGTGLGELKLEYVIKDGCFVRPKFYYTVEDSGKEHVKVKGTRIASGAEFCETIDSGKKITRMKFASFQMCNRMFRGRYTTWNEVMFIKKSLRLEDTKRDWGGQTLDRKKLQESVPFTLVDGVLTEEYNAMMLKAQAFFENTKFEEREKFFESDEWDKAAVGHDIDNHEHWRLERDDTESIL